jgi:hypothetical protein
MENSNLEEQKYIRAKKRVKSIRGFYSHLAVYLGVNLLLVILRIISDESLEILWDWTTYNTAIFWGIGLLFHALNVFGMGFILGNDWEERKIKELMDKDKKQYWE